MDQDKILKLLRESKNQTNPEKLKTKATPEPKEEYVIIDELAEVPDSLWKKLFKRLRK